jgi:hypothetical protein
MTFMKHGKTAAALVFGAMVALGTLASPASARWYGDGRWHDDDRRWEKDHYNGYNYRPPPVYYGTPYNYGYQAPPVYYDNTPGFTFRLF